jgi:hypothetical protein
MMRRITSLVNPRFCRSTNRRRSLDQAGFVLIAHGDWRANRVALG